MRLYLDAGHGGNDPGVLWKGDGNGDGQVAEQTITLDVARLTADALRGLGWPLDVRLTRDDDRTLELDARGELVEQGAGEFVISIHVNSSPDPKVGGLMVFTWPGNSLARKIAQTIARAAPRDLYRERIVVHEAAAGVDWLRRARAVLGAFRCPTVLVELGHLTHEGDRHALCSTLTRRGLVAALLAGISELTP